MLSCSKQVIYFQKGTQNILVTNKEWKHWEKQAYNMDELIKGAKTGYCQSRKAAGYDFAYFVMHIFKNSRLFGILFGCILNTAFPMRLFFFHRWIIPFLFINCT